MIFLKRYLSVPCVESMEISTYRLLALVKDATEYLNAGVAAREKGGGGKRARGRVKGRPVGVRERWGERTGRNG